MAASLRLRLRKAKLSRGRPASGRVLLLLVVGLVLGVVCGRVAERVELTLELSLAVFQDLDLHGVPLSLGQSQLLLSPFALRLLAQRRQSVEETVSVVDERHGNHRLGFVWPDVDVVARKHFVVRVDKVQDLYEPGGVCSLLAKQEQEQLVQLANVLSVLVKVSSSVMDLADEDLLGWWREANWRLPDVLCSRTEDLASTYTRHEVQRTERLLLGGQQPAVAEHAVVVGLAVADYCCDLFSGEHPC